MSDLGTVIWKELVELLHAGQRQRASMAFSLLLPPAIVLALSLAVNQPLLAVATAIAIGPPMAVFVALGLIPDVAAGERERHTLETLLASRLPETAIVFGKIFAVLAWSMGLSVVSLLLVTVALAIRFGNPLLLPLFPIALMAYVPAVFVAFLFACLGMIVSARAATVQQAAQVTILAPILLFFVPMIGMRSFGPNVGQVLMRLDAGDWILIALWSVLGFLAATALAAYGARAVFRRRSLLVRKSA